MPRPRAPPLAAAPAVTRATTPAATPAAWRRYKLADDFIEALEPLRRIPRARLKEKLEEMGGLGKLSANKFTALVQEAMSPHPITYAQHIHYALRKLRPHPTAAKKHQLLVEYIFARASLEAFAASVRTMSGGLVGEKATRDNTYYFR